MPYGVRRRGGKFVVINTDTGDVKGTHDTEEKAEEQRRLLEGIKRGWKPSHGR